MKKIVKLGLKIVFTLVILLVALVAFLAIKYNEDVPQGVEGIEADALAIKMETVLNKKAFDSTSCLEWSFRNMHHYRWFKLNGTCEVSWDDYKVNLNFGKPIKTTAFKNNIKLEAEEGKKLIKKATDYFNNDSFWLVAPFKTFDKGVKRSIVTTENGDDALLVTYTSGGTTPGDSYLWLLKEDGKPYAYKMWTSILPLKGIEASWNDWIEVKSGAILPKSHKLLFMTIEMGEVKGY